MGKRTNDLADRLEHGARALAAFANELSDVEWQLRERSTAQNVTERLPQVYDCSSY